MKNLQSIVDKCAQLRNVIKDAEKELDQHKNDLKEYAAENNLLVLDGQKFIAVVGDRNNPYTIDKKLLQKEFPTIYDVVAKPPKTEKSTVLTFKQKNSIQIRTKK